MASTARDRRIDGVEVDAPPPPYAVAAMPPRERVQHRHAIDASPNAGGPASKGNFTTFDDDGWWDDDENYWDDDYDWF